MVKGKRVITLTKKDNEFIKKVNNFCKLHGVTVETVWRLSIGSMNSENARDVISGKVGIMLNTAGKIEEWMDEYDKR